MLSATLFLFGLGLAASIMLVVASKFFHVSEDPKIEKVEDALLGANCGACGFTGCAGAAEAVVKGKAGADVCVAGGSEIALGVAEVLGITVEEKEAEISRPGCRYGLETADLKYDYEGIMDCRAAMLLSGGSKECKIGCLGLGTCVRVCPFDALSMGPDDLPVVNKKRCTGCGLCEKICPKGIISLTSATKRILSDIKVSECTAPCQRECPAEIDVPEYIRQIAEGNYRGAVSVIREKNPFPLICGWICPNPCEFTCRRNLVDQPVAINALKKFASNYEMETGQRGLPEYIPPATGKRIAVVGGGVEGLTAAYYLRRLGNVPKILEATGKLGGILRYVITEDRLPGKVIDWDIAGILETGVEAETSAVMGKDFTLTSLLEEGFEMVLLTAGGWDSRQILQENKSVASIIPGSYLLLDFITAYTAGENLNLGKKAVILGGGKSSSKCATICLEHNVNEVTIVFPFSRETALENGIEILAAENVKYIFSGLPLELTGAGDRLSGLAIGVENGEAVRISLDNLIVGSGRFPEMLFSKTAGNLWKTVEIFKVFPGKENAGIFPQGEIGFPSDLSSVVVTVKRGRKIARAVLLHINGEEIAPEWGVLTDEKDLQNIFEITDKKDLLKSRVIVDNNTILSEDDARYEASRCLDCGLICYMKKLKTSAKKGSAAQ